MYPQEITVGAILNENASSAATAVQLTAAANVCGTWGAHYPFVVQRMTFRVSTAVNDLTSTVVAMNLITNATNSTPTTAQICTMTIKNGATANSVYYNNCSPTTVPFSGKLQFAIKTAGSGGGTPAGAGFFGFYGTLQPESLLNSTNAINVTA